MSERPARALVLASQNAHKIAEIAAMAQARGLALEVAPASAFGSPPEIAEDADSFVGNATKKAREIAAWLTTRGAPGDTLVLADDSGVSVDALDGAPGIYSARFAGEDADDAANNRKVVAELRARGLEASPAHYTCALALVRVDGRPLAAARGDLESFLGRWDGVLRAAARGTGGFGYDPHVWLSWPGPSARTVAELSRDEKAALSHRGQAMRLLFDALARDIL